MWQTSTSAFAPALPARNFRGKRGNHLGKAPRRDRPGAGEQFRPERDDEIWLQFDLAPSPRKVMRADRPRQLRLTTRMLGCVGSTVAECLAQPHRIAYRAQRLIGDNDAEIGDVERLPIGRAGNPRHIDDDVMKLRAQNADQGLDRVRR